nr:probable LRR receptor-like serine/threonine-protein kinase At1g67720 isoform X2 [Ipomoea trifida]
MILFTETCTLNLDLLEYKAFKSAVGLCRYFPSSKAKKYCYSLPVAKGKKLLVKTVYYYCGFDGGKEPPVFDQIIDGTKWFVIDTKANYAKGLSSYYEAIVMAHGMELTVCLARNEHTGNSNPFISVGFWTKNLNRNWPVIFK